MSMCYWLIEGIGIDVEKIVPFLDKKDLAHWDYHKIVVVSSV